MSTTKPKVSVLLPIYQGETYLREAIDSILNQTFTDIELIIVDDASTDGSAEIIQSYSDSRIRFVQNNTNLGLIATLNAGLDLALGEYVARMDQDDISLPERLSKQVAFMDSRTELAASGTWARNIGGDGRVFSNRTLKLGNQILYGYWWPTPIIHPSAIIRKSCLRDIRYDSGALHCEDYDLWLRLRKQYALDNLPEYLLLYRVHDKSTSVKHRETQLRSMYRVLCRHTGLIISYEEFLELINVTRRLDLWRRFALRARLARAIRKPYGRFAIDELLIGKDWLGTIFRPRDMIRQLIQSFYRIWLRIRPYEKLTPKGRG